MSDSKSPRVLVTGGCGFIGTNLCEFLLEKTDFSIVILDNLSVGKLSDIENVRGFDKSRVTFIKGDIRNEEDIKKAMEGCTHVVSLAAQTGVIPSVEDPSGDEEVNVRGTLNLLRAAVDNKVERFIHASSAAPLGEQDMPLNEDKVPRPLSPYGASKLAGEGYCSAFSGSFGLDTVVLRFSNVYGPKSYNKGSVIPKFIKRILDGKELVIYGDGRQTRDFIYVKDICSAIHLALTARFDSKSSLIQIGTGRETDINRLVGLLKKGFPGKTIRTRFAEARQGEIVRNYTDISRAQKMLGFEPEVELEKGLVSTIGWFVKKDL